MDKDYEKLLQYALRIISKKRYTQKEMREKLGRFFKKREFEGEAESVVEQVLGRLGELRYLDDESFCRDYINQRAKLRPRGRFLLNRELKMKGIDSDLIEKTMKDLEFDEEEAARLALEKAERRWSGLEKKKAKDKAYRYLASRGFKGDTIYKSLEDW